MGYPISDLTGAAWRKSSHSDSTGGECVETAPLDAAWFKSSHSNASGGHCVETAALGPHIGVRDSKNADGPALVVTAAQWQPLLAHTKRAS